MVTKSELAIILSKLRVFETPKVSFEQYPTDSEVAADILWKAFMNYDIQNKVVADLGCGTGILGIGALLLGAKKVYFVDHDATIIPLLQQNLEAVKASVDEYMISTVDVLQFTVSVDTVIENPPFGTKIKHADKLFLEQAFKLGKVIYSIHKLTSKGFLDAISKDHGFKITHVFELKLPIKATQKFHTRRLYPVDVGCWRLEKENLTGQSFGM